MLRVCPPCLTLPGAIHSDPPVGASTDDKLSPERGQLNQAVSGNRAWALVSSHWEAVAWHGWGL